MNKIAALAKREVSGLFFSLVGYIVLAVYLIWMGYLFAVAVLIPGQTADMRMMFTFSHLGLIFVVPLMTMSMFADEYASGRIEMLRTSPITELDILLGKFLGAMGFYAVILATTFVYVLLLALYGRPNYGAILAGYFGLLLLGVMTVPIGLFFSSITRHQIVACILGIITILTLAFLLDMAYGAMVSNNISLFSPTLTAAVRDTMQYLSFRPHMESFAKGVVEVRDICYFLTGGGLFLLLTYLVLESRKWR